MSKSYKEKIFESVNNNKLITWIIILFIVLTAFLNFYKNIIDIFPKGSSAEDKLYAKQMIIDLEKAKNLLPDQQSFLDCLERRKGESISVWEACIRDRKSSESDPVKIIEKNITLVKFSFSEEQQEILVPLLERLLYLSYEMQNNQGVLSYWFREGCSSNVKLSNKPPTVLNPKDSAIRCTLIVQPYQDYIESAFNNIDSVSAVRKYQVALDESQVFISQGQETTIESYFLEKNNLEYSEWQKNFESLIDKTKSILL